VLADRAEDVVLFDVSPPLEARGIDAYRAAWELFFSFQGAGTFRLGELDVVAGGDVAFAHGVVTVGPLDPAGQFPVRLTVGLARRHGRWLVTHEHHSVLSP
jgi:ketosteroid isomerase-like protein